MEAYWFLQLVLKCIQKLYACYAVVISSNEIHIWSPSLLLAQSSKPLGIP